MSETGYSVRVLAEGEQPGSADATYIDGILLVSRDYPLPRNQGGSNAEANAALCSGFRRLRQQRDMTCRCCRGTVPLMSRWCFSTAMCARTAWSWRSGTRRLPGQSEHQTGLCFDVASLYRTFATTEAGIWLNEHCAEYGFIIRYPENSEDITGYMYETLAYPVCRGGNSPGYHVPGDHAGGIPGRSLSFRCISTGTIVYTQTVSRKGKVRSMLNRGLAPGGGGSRGA